MAWLSCFLTFRGRLGRGPFLRLLFVAAAAGGAILAAIALIGFALSVAFASRQVLTGPCLVLGAACLAALAWCSLALAARRLRDIGLDPWRVLPAWFVFTQVDALVLSRWLRGGDPSFTAQTPFGAGVGTALLVLLILWPGRSAIARAAISPRTARSGSRPA